MNAVGRGDFRRQITVKGDDELSNIVRVFNDMSKNIYQINSRLRRFSEFTFFLFQQQTEDDILNLTLEYLEKIFLVDCAEIFLQRNNQDTVLRSSESCNGKNVYTKDLYINNVTIGTVKIYRTDALTEDEQSTFGLFATVVSRAIEKIRDYEQVTQIQEELLHFERLSTVGIMVGTILHEVNNPLSVIMGYSEMIISEPLEKKNVQNYAKGILESSLRIKKTIDDMLIFLRRSDREKVCMDLNEIVRIVLRLKNIDLRKKNIKVFTELSEAPVKAYIIPNQIEQVLLNIINNAEYAMFQFHGGGILSIKTRSINENVEVVIEDNGPGMSEDVLGKIFDFFFTTKPPGEGTGLGLPIVSKIIESHNGKIDVKSEKGKGTTFIISIPRAHDDKETA